MKKRKPVLIVDDSPDSLKATDLLRKRDIEFVEYNIRKFADSCCGDLPTTKAPSVFAPEGVFKGLSGVGEYASSAEAAATQKKEPRVSQRVPIGSYRDGKYHNLLKQESGRKCKKVK